MRFKLSVFVIAPLSRQRIPWIEPMAVASGSQDKSVNAGGRIMTGCAFHFSRLAFVSFSAVRNPIFTLSAMMLSRALQGSIPGPCQRGYIPCLTFPKLFVLCRQFCRESFFPLFPCSLPRFFAVTAFSPSTIIAVFRTLPSSNTKSIFFKIRHISKSYKRFALSAR